MLALFLLSALTISTITCESSEALSKKSEKEIAALIDSFIDELVQKDEFSGTVLVSRNGKPFYKRAVGEAIKRDGVPNKIDTKFNLGSMNKMLTSTAISQLVQQGKLSYDDLIGKHLPDYPNEAVREKVSVHHLLTHTSGMGHYWTELFQHPNWTMLKTVKDYADLTSKKPLEFEPGERFQYSNCGPIVLGLIIEKISGLSYDEYIQQNITDPAGMKNTFCYDISKPVPNLATGYSKRNLRGETLKDRIENNSFTPTKGGPAGGGYSTVEDLLRFDIALRSHKLLDEKHFAIMTAGKTDRDSNRKYAYLFEEQFRNGHRIIGHGGGAPGINSQLYMFMDLDYTVAVMSNYDPPTATAVANKIMEWLIEE
jgi:CubicO group peptidase (beta-lactamase class C family)